MRTAIVTLVAGLLVHTEPAAAPDVAASLHAAPSKPIPPDPLPIEPATCAWIDTENGESYGPLIKSSFWENNQSHIACRGTCAGGMESCHAVAGMGSVTCGDCQTQAATPHEDRGACDEPR